MKEFTLADEADLIGKEVENCRANNDCEKCDCYDCPIHPDAHIDPLEEAYR